jgi:hypothetical protein
MILQLTVVRTPSVQKLSPVSSENTVEIYYAFKPDLLDLVILFS